MLAAFVLASFPGALDLATGLAEAERTSRKLVVLVERGASTFADDVEHARTPSVLFARADAESEPVRDVFEIDELPCVLVLAPDGREIDRLYGSKSAAELREQLTFVLAYGGERPPVHAKFRAAPHAQLERAHELASRGRWDEAARACLRELDVRAGGETATERARRDDAVASWRNYARRARVGLDALVHARDAALERITCGTAFPQDDGDLARFAAVLAAERRDEHAPLALYDELARAGRLTRAREKELWPLVVDALVARGRFVEAARSWRLPMEAAEEFVPGLGRCLYATSLGCGMGVWESRDVLARLPRLEPFYVACLRAGASECTTTLERELTAGRLDVRVYAFLASANVHAGACERARAFLEQAESIVGPHLAPGVVPPWLADARAIVATCR